MPKPAARASSRYSREAIALLGQTIRLKRIEQRIPAASLAERAGLSRALLRRIERGDPGCGIGAVFEVAAILGVPLFEADRARLSTHLAHAGEKLTLLPKTARLPQKAVKDDF
ncbi:helix-turn-helix transcriptional regulator [Ferrovibrio sp.]|uniref:helix-turn-helix transcriptional regulator n=1 Tax=Ferrovibrio sp. TaxID=1917215 RepID=UPI003D0D54E1